MALDHGSEVSGSGKEATGSLQKGKKKKKTNQQQQPFWQARRGQAAPQPRLIAFQQLQMHPGKAVDGPEAPRERQPRLRPGRKIRYAGQAAYSTAWHRLCSSLHAGRQAPMAQKAAGHEDTMAPSGRQDHPAER